MGDTIDSLNIEVQASAKKANGSIETLIRKLDRLSSSLMKVDGKNMVNLSSGVGTLSTAMQGMKNAGVGKADFNRLATGIERIGKINGDSISSVGNSLKPFADAVTSLSSTNFDNKNLQNLINSITRLSNSNINGVSNADFSKLGNSIVALSQTLSNADKVQQNTISMTNAIANLTKAGEKSNYVALQLPALGIALKSLMSTMGTAPVVSSEVISFTQAIGELAKAGDKAGKTASNLGILATELKKFMQIMSTAPVVSQNLIDMTNALAKLARTGASSGRAANSLSASLNTYTTATSRATRGTKGLAYAFGKLYASYWMLFRAFRKIGDAIDISSDLTEVQNVVDVTFGNMTYKVEELADTSIEQFGMSELALKQYASRFQAMGSAMGIDTSSIESANAYLNSVTDGYIGLSNSMSDVSLNLTKLTADMASFYNVEQSDVAEDLESIFTGQTRPLRTYGLDLTEATLKEWALKNGLDANIDSMSQAEKTMIRYQYVLANTGAAQGDFARTSDTWANQIRILKQNFQQLGATIGGDFINMLKPFVKAMNTAMGYVNAFAKTISNALGKIFGWKYEESGGGITNDLADAEDSAGGIASGIGSAADNAKKLKNTLRSFDELNVITTESDSGSGSGSGSSSGSVSGASGGQWVETESILDEFESDIDSLYELGDYIGDTLTNMLNDINWDSVYQGARNFGSGLASFLNGLFSSDDEGNNVFSATGTTIAGALNTAIYAALAFGETFDFEEFGEAIASGINSFFEDFDFAALAETLNVWADGIIEAIAAVLKGITWTDVMGAVGTFLGSLELETVTLAIAGFSLRSITGGAKTALRHSIVNKLGTLKLLGVSVMLGGISWLLEESEKEDSDLASMVESSFMTAIGAKMVSGNWIVSGWAFAISFSISIEDWLFDNGYETIWDYFKGNKKTHFGAGKHFGDEEDEIKSAANGIGSYMADGISEGFQNEYEKNNEEDSNGFFSNLWNSICNVFGIHSPAKEMEPLGEYMLLGIVEGFTGSFGEIGTAITDLWNNHIKPLFTFSKWLEIGAHIKGAFSTKWNEFSTWFSGTAAAEFWNTKVKPKFSTEYWIGKIGSIKDAFSTKWNELTTWWSGLSIKFPSIKIPTFSIDGSFSFNPPSVPKIKITWPQYAVGGFPEDGLFLANHGELVGKFSNGKTAVANNEQITGGIADAVYPAVYNAVSAAMKNNGGNSNVTFKVEGDPNGIFKVVRKQANEYHGKTGKPAFDC